MKGELISMWASVSLFFHFMFSIPREEK